MRGEVVSEHLLALSDCVIPVRMVRPGGQAGGLTAGGGFTSLGWQVSFYYF